MDPVALSNPGSKFLAKLYVAVFFLCEIAHMPLFVVLAAVNAQCSDPLSH